MTADDLIRRRPQVPVPCEGYAIVSVRKLDPVKTEAGIVIAMHKNPMPGFTDEETQVYERYTIVATSGCWYAGACRVEHKAKVGDVVLMGPGAGYMEFDRDPRWVMGHRLIALQDVRSFYPCETESKGDA